MEYHMISTKIKSRSSDTIVPVFFDVAKDNDEIDYYIPKDYNSKFQQIIKKFNDSGNFLEITGENVYDVLTSDFTLEFYPFDSEIMELIKSIISGGISIPLFNEDRSFSKFIFQLSKSFRKIN